MKEEVENAPNSEYSYYSYSESESESTESESESTTSSDSYYSDEPAKPATDVLKMAYAIPPADVSKQLACGADEEDDEDNPNVKIAEVCAAKKLEGEPKSSEKTTAAKPVGKAKSKSQRPSSQALLEASAAAQAFSSAGESGSRSVSASSLPSPVGSSCSAAAAANSPPRRNRSFGGSKAPGGATAAHDASVFVLQSDKAARKWPADDGVEGRWFGRGRDPPKDHGSLRPILATQPL